MTFNQNSQIETEILNITNNPTDDLILNSLTNHIGFFPRDIEVQFTSKLLRLTREKIKVACQIVGCKPVLAKSLSDQAFDSFLHIASKNCNIPTAQDNTRHYIYTTQTNFLEIFREELKTRNLTKDRNILDFELALNIIEQSQSMIVLLGGTSGSGKSTVASLLASRFGIPTVLSTDSIRHIMRNFMTAEECPVLFCSTYEAGTKIKCDEEVKESKRIVMGFQQQAAKVQQRLETILQDFHDRGESIVVEGVHLTPDFLTAMLKKFDNCIPFVIYISNESKHRERFAVRSKYMTLEKRHNKYVQNFVSIRHIQKHLTKKADEYLIPKIDNSNVDKSVGIVHRTIVRCLRRIMKGESLYDPENNNALKIYEQFNTVTKNIWSSEAVKKYIHAKGKKTYKNEIFKRFFEQNKKTLTKDDYDKIEPEVRQNLLGNQTNEDLTAEKHYSSEKKNDSQPANKNKAFKEDFIVLDPQVKEFSEKPKYTKSETFEVEKNEDSQTYPDSPDRPRETTSNYEQEPIDMKELLGRGKSFEEGDEREFTTQKSMDFGNVSKSQENLKVLINMVNRPGPFVKPVKIKSEEVKLEDSGYQAGSLNLGHRSSVKLSLLEEALKTRRVLTIKGGTQANIRALRRFVDGYNTKHHDSVLKLYQDNERLILQKQRKNEKVEKNEMDNSPLEVRSRKLKRFATKKYDDFTKNSHEHERVNDANTSEDNLEASDEESSPGVNSQEQWSTATGNLAVDLQMRKRGSTYYNLSDKLDMSDDMGSGTGLEEGETSLEVVQSGNSISEQSIEEEEDEDDDVKLMRVKSGKGGVLVENVEIVK